MTIDTPRRKKKMRCENGVVNTALPHYVFTSSSGAQWTPAPTLEISRALQSRYAVQTVDCHRLVCQYRQVQKSAASKREHTGSTHEHTGSRGRYAYARLTGLL